MNKRRNVVIALMILLSLGFAAVSTTLVINGLIGIGENKDDFRVIFTKAIDGGYDASSRLISDDGLTIDFESDYLYDVGEEYVFDYEVTNFSKSYDADIKFTYNIEENGLVDVDYEPKTMQVPAGESQWGKITIRLLKVVTDDCDLNVSLKLDASAMTRDSLGGYTKYNTPNTLMTRPTYYSSTGEKLNKFWDYARVINHVVFENELSLKEDAVHSYDVSSGQDGTVLAYLVPNEETLSKSQSITEEDGSKVTYTTGYTLYIQGNEIIYGSFDSSKLFQDFQNLVDITGFEYFDTSNVEDMSEMFLWCYALTSIDLSHFNTSNVTTMADMFSNCRALTNLDVSSFDTKNVTDMSWMFNCFYGEYLDISPLNTSNVLTMEKMFNGCRGLKSLDLTTLDTSNVTNMSSLFSGCSGLTSIDLTPLDTSKVTDMSYMFSGCSGLTSIDLTPLDTKNVKRMIWLFEGCKGLTSIDLSPLDTTNVYNMEGMFYRCSGLTSLDLSPLNTSNVTNMTNMFNGCAGLTSLDLSPLDTSEVWIVNGIFEECTGLTSIDLSPLDTSKLVNIGRMFMRCSNLTSINFENFNTSNVNYMNDMFYDCDSLVNLDLTMFDTRNVTDMSWMFWGCSNLTNLNLSTWNTSNVTNMYHTFTSCGSLNVLDISNFSFAKVTTENGKRAIFGNVNSSAVLYVKNKDAQDWILGLTSDRPSSWTTDNVVIKNA